MGLLTRSHTSLASGFLGRVSYDDGTEIQEHLRDRLIADADYPDCLIQLEHPPVYTIGRRGNANEILWNAKQLAHQQIEVRAADRGGQVTYHGPGQLVGYPIVRLSPTGDLVGYVRKLETTIIKALNGFGIDGSRVAGRSGVWVNDRKIAAIGIRVARGVTKHGYAINVAPDLSHFAGIVPCGITDAGVTSMRAVGVEATLEAVADCAQKAFIETFGYVTALELPIGQAAIA